MQEFYVCWVDGITFLDKGPDIATVAERWSSANVISVANRNEKIIRWYE